MTEQYVTMKTKRKKGLFIGGALFVLFIIQQEVIFNRTEKNYSSECSICLSEINLACIETFDARLCQNPYLIKMENNPTIIPYVSVDDQLNECNNPNASAYMLDHDLLINLEKLSICNSVINEIWQALPKIEGCLLGNVHLHSHLSFSSYSER